MMGFSNPWDTHVCVYSFFVKKQVQNFAYMNVYPKREVLNELAHLVNQMKLKNAGIPSLILEP